MKPLFVIWIMLVMLTTAAVFGEELILEYSDGPVSIKNGDSWDELYIGDAIPADAVISLEEGVVAEISGEKENITLSKPGVYRISELISQKKKLSSWNVGSLLKNKISTVTQARKEKGSEVMGVRGAQAGSDTEVEWAEDEVNYIKDAKVLLEQNKVEKAITLLKEGIEGEPDDPGEYNFYLGVSYAKLGKPARAIKYFQEVEPDPYTDYFPEYVLISGTLYLDSMAYEDAEKLFEMYLENYPEGLHSQIINYLSAISLYNMDERDKAISRMKKAYSMDKNSEIGKMAEKLLASW